MIEPQWSPSLNDEHQTRTQSSRLSDDTNKSAESRTDLNQRILLKSPPLLNRRPPEERTTLTTPAELSNSQSREKRLLALEQQARLLPSPSSSDRTFHGKSSGRTQTSRPKDLTLNRNCQFVRVTGFRSYYDLEVPCDASIQLMIDILWKKISDDNKNCASNTHNLFLFNHRTHIFPEVFEELVSDLLLSTPESAITHFYFYITKKGPEQENPYECINSFTDFCLNSAWQNSMTLTDFSQLPQSKSILLISMHTLQWLSHQQGTKEHNKFNQSNFLNELSKYIFLPAIIALTHALSGSMFLFEISLLIDAFLELLLLFCPPNLPRNQLGSLTPFLLCWLLEQINLEERNEDNHETFQRVLLDDARLSNNGLSSSTSLFDPFEYLVYDYYRSHLATRQQLPSIFHEGIEEFLDIIATKYPELASIIWSASHINLNDELTLYQHDMSSIFFTDSYQHSSAAREPVGTNDIHSSMNTARTKNRNITQTSSTDLILRNSGVDKLRRAKTGSSLSENRLVKQILVVIFDVSRSMFEKYVDKSRSQTVFELSKEMLFTLRNNLELVKDYALGLITFGEYISVDCAITTDHDEFKNAVTELIAEPQPWTCMYDAVIEAIDLIDTYEDELSKNKRSANKCTKRILCLSDGINNHGTATIDFVRERVIKVGVIIDFVSFLPYKETDNKDELTIKQFEDLCRETKGRTHRNIPTLTKTMKTDFVEAVLRFLERLFDDSKQRTN